MKNHHKNLRKAIDSAQKAQRNYDLSKSIPQEDLDTLIYAAQNSPSKQNETHYQLHVFTDQEIIRKIYQCTKRFCLFTKDDDYSKLFGEVDGVYWQSEERSLYNSQVLANALFVYAKDDGNIRGCSHITGHKKDNPKSQREFQRQQNYSIGISSGQLVLVSALMGLKTGMCSSFDKSIEPVIDVENKVHLLVGVGYEDSHKDRRIHPETLNRDVPDKFKNGKDNENWRFPSFDKECKVFLNGERYNTDD